MTPHPTTQAPSDWLRRWAHLIPDRPGGARVLDLACGHGRHTRWLVRQGCHVTAVDRDAEALSSLASLAPMVHLVQADIENGPWPIEGQTFDAVVVTHYLWRPLWPQILGSLKPEGILVYETFTRDHASIGKPSRPDFLLAPGELLQVCAHLRTVAFEEGFISAPDRFVQRIVAVNTRLHPPAQPDAAPCRFSLQAAG